MSGNLWIWIGFHLLIIALLALDLGVFHKHSHKVTTKEAAAWSGVWIGLALAFNVFLYFVIGEAGAVDFFTGYLIEKTLSIDNIFVFIMIFSYFQVPDELQHRVLFWGVVGALIMRGVLIAVGASLIARFHWVFYFFGVFVMFTGYKMWRSNGESTTDPTDSFLVRLARRLLPMTDTYEGEHFFVRRGRVLHATPLFLVLLVVEMSDLVFAVDSIPAVFAITTDTMIVYTSNIFAILGLRSLYFLLANVVQRFRYLSKGLAVLLVFIGIKMLLMDVLPIPTSVSLGIIVAVLTSSVLLSLRRPVPKPVT